MLDHDQLIPEERESQHLIEKLRRYYGTQEADRASLERIRARLLQKSAKALPVTDAKDPLLLPRSLSAGRGATKRARHPRLVTLAAVLFLGVLVSSFVLVFYLKPGTTTTAEPPVIKPGWTLVATFEGTGSKTIPGLHLEVGQRLGTLLTCSHSSSNWADVEILPEKFSAGTTCSNPATNPLGPGGEISSQSLFPPLQTIKIQTDASTSWQLYIFSGYPPLSIDTKIWHILHNEVDGTGNGDVIVDSVLPATWALEYRCTGTGNIELGVQPVGQGNNLNIRVATSPCDAQTHRVVPEALTSNGTFQGIDSILITTSETNSWQMELLGCVASKSQCSLPATPGSSS